MTDDRRLATVFARAEDAFGSLALAVMVFLPLGEIVFRKAFGRGIPASGPIVSHLTLWVGFLGAAIAARDGKLLALATGTFIPPGPWRRAADILAAGFGAMCAIVLAWGGWQMTSIEREGGANIGAGIPTWIAQIVLPIGFAMIALRVVWRVGALSAAHGGDAGEGSARPQPSDTIWIDRALAALGLAAGVLMIAVPSTIEARPLLPILALVVVSAVSGTPLFAILGGIAALLFMREGTAPGTILIEIYSLSVSPTLPAIPLFTLAGFLLAEGKASERLLRVFRAFFGWIPGGTAVVCAVLCSFFTVFTGGSGV